MDLSDPATTGHDRIAAQGLVPEYIHRQIAFDIADWEGAGRLVGFAGIPMPGEPLLGLRQRHLNALETRFAGARAWMGSPL